VIAIEPIECSLRSGELRSGLTNSPASGFAIHSEHRPASAILAAQVHEDCVPVVLHPDAVVRIPLLVKHARVRSVRLGYERRPTRPRRPPQARRLIHALSLTARNGVPHQAHQRRGAA
jgi:hypothetical protein